MTGGRPARRSSDVEGLLDVARAAFGTGRCLVAVSRLAGGSKKGVYRLDFADGWTAAAYIWHPGIDLFEVARAQLNAAGVRTPRVYYADRSRCCYPADIALVEFVPGGSLESRLRDDPRAAEPSVARLGWSVAAMRRHRSSHVGRPGRPLAADDAARRSEQPVLDRARRQLAEAAGRVERIAAVRSRLADLLDSLAAAVPPRSEYSLVHGELGPDHVLIDEHGQPVLIDVEGTMYFDPEWEHVFLRLRFGRHYRWLRDSDLDERRLRFYGLALSLSLVAGPLRLLDGEFPDRAEMAAIVASNITRTLSFVR